MCFDRDVKFLACDYLLLQRSVKLTLHTFLCWNQTEILCENEFRKYFWRPNFWPRKFESRPYRRRTSYSDNHKSNQQRTKVSLSSKILANFFMVFKNLRSTMNVKVSNFESTLTFWKMLNFKSKKKFKELSYFQQRFLVYWNNFKEPIEPWIFT